jgi:type I restriction enzyme S subunit
MNPQTFLANFGYVANAPDGVKSLRQLVMASALAGKFSAPNDDLPSDIETLLEEARSLHFRSAGKREKPLLFAAPLIQEFEIPVGWKWVRVGQICDLQTGATPSTRRPDYWGGEIPWLASGDVNLREIFECEGRITEEGLANSNCKLLPKNSVLIALNGQGKTRATVALLRIPAACNQSLVAMIPFDVRIVTPEYLFLSLRYRYYEIRDITGQDQRRGLNMGLVSDLSVPLAPLAEQKRIVAKVDELMALCDQLEAQQQERERHFPVLSRTCHASFAAAPTPANLNRIFDETGAVSPVDLRRTILNLAVQGKLVSHELDDKPAITDLDEIDAEKTALNAARKLRPNIVAELPQITALQYAVPDAWRWFRLGDVAFFQEGPGIRNWQFRPQGIKLLNVQNIVDGKLILANTDRHISTEEFESTYRHFAVETGDILFASSGASWGKTAWFEDPGYTVVLNTSMVRLKFYSKRCDDKFLFLFLRSEFFKTQMEIQLVGIQPNFGSTHLGRVYIPLPPLAEQRRIVTKVDELMALVDQLETQQQERDKLAEAFARACVASFTGTTQLERPEKMKAPKTELVSLVTLGNKPKPDAKAPLAQLLIQSKGTLPAKSLWQQSGLSIDAFYQQLKTEISQGWIAPPQEAEMKVTDEVTPHRHEPTSRARRIDLDL